MVFLNFSDAAKFADVARNIFQGMGYGSSFTFFNGGFSQLTSHLFPAGSILPVTPYSILLFFKMLGVNDIAVIASSLFYFILTLIFVFLLTKNIFKRNLVAILSTIAVGFNYDLIDYATKGASESPFIFEIVSSLYFLSIKKKWATALGFLLLVLMYFTREQAFIYIAGIVLFYLLSRFKPKMAITSFFIVSAAALLIDRFILFRFALAGNLFLYSVTANGMSVGSKFIPGTSVSDALRAVSSMAPTISIVKKIFYDLYNFYKLLPQIMNPYLFALFVIGLFSWKKDGVQNSFKVASIFMVVVTFIVVAASIPFFRYIHPIIPLVYIIAVGTLVDIISKSKFLISKRRYIVIASTFLILVFGVGQTLGVFLLDSRFEANTHNVGKPPVYVVLSQILKENTQSNQVVITNLDTWGSWYGERKTVWFPLEPKQLINPNTGKISFDAIYLTSYLIDDQNYLMGAEWRTIFNNPTNPKSWTCSGCGEIAKEFKLGGVYKIASNSNYERQEAYSILLIKK